MSALAETRASTVRLEARGLQKRFPGVMALSGVDLALRPGTVHALVGENGAGKSTLIKILSGFYAPDEGEVLVNGEPLVANTAAARAHGIATIHQEHNLVPYLSVAENVGLGGLPTRFGLVSRRQVRRTAREVVAEVAPSVSISQPARTLSAAEGQLVEVARALAQRARVLIMDEPTTALTERDVERLFRLVRRLREQGMAVLYVSHKLEEVFALSDEITVLRDGRLVTTAPVGEFDRAGLVRAMVGEDVAQHRHAVRSGGEPVLEARGLGLTGVFADVDLTLRAGEVLGLSGLVGSGRSELAMCLFGADRLDAGTVELDGHPLHLRSPADAVRAGIALVPEERKQQALVEALSVRENLTLGMLDQLAPGGWLRRRTERDVVAEFVESLRIRTPGMDVPIAGLSGGNQQKVVIARWLARRPRVLMLDEPTKGIDVGAKAEIHKLIERLCDAGVAVLLISSELDELLALADRVAVMREGRLIRTLDRDAASREEVIRLATAD